MSEIIAQRTGAILSVQFNRPDKKNALTVSMYQTVADLLDAAAVDDGTRVVLLHGAGDSFSAGNDIADFLKNPPGPDDSPQSRFTEALMNFDKPLIAAVQGVAVGSGATMLTHCDFVYAAEHATFQLPFVKLGVVPELGTSYTLPAELGYLAAAELILLGLPFDAHRAAELGFVTRVVLDANVLATATETAQRLAQLPTGALQVSKRLLKRSSREQIAAAVKAENHEFAARIRSADAKEALTAFLEKRRPDFTQAKTAPAVRAVQASALE